jgi:hypothetical protein
MFKFLKDLFSTSPATGPHPLDGPTRSAPYKVESPPPGLEIVAEPASVVIERHPAPKVEIVAKPAVVVQPVPSVPKKKAKAKAPVPAAKKAVGKNPRGRKPKDQSKKSK